MGAEPPEQQGLDTPGIKLRNIYGLQRNHNGRNITQHSLFPELSTILEVVDDVSALTVNHLM
jgi:hypothetical protein